jgi:hypothetical protein
MEGEEVEQLRAEFLADKVDSDTPTAGNGKGSSAEYSGGVKAAGGASVKPQVEQGAADVKMGADAQLREQHLLPSGTAECEHKESTVTAYEDMAAVKGGSGSGAVTAGEGKGAAVVCGVRAVDVAGGISAAAANGGGASGATEKGPLRERKALRLGEELLGEDVEFAELVGLTLIKVSGCAG